MKNLSFADIIICIIVGFIISLEIMVIVLSSTSIVSHMNPSTLENTIIVFPFAVYLIVAHILSLWRHFPH